VSQKLLCILEVMSLTVQTFTWQRLNDLIDAHERYREKKRERERASERV